MLVSARVRPFLLPLFALAIAMPVFAEPAPGVDRLQRSVAVTESFLPLAFLVLQGTDTTFELAVFATSVALQTVPNAVMLLGERAERPGLTRISRWVNFGIDSALAGGLLGVGAAHLAGAFGPEPDTRARGGYYLALAIPAGVAAFADFMPYTIESGQ